MNTIELKFEVNGQYLLPDNRLNGLFQHRLASHTVNYVKAVFELDDTWKGFDAVTAIWRSGYDRIAVVLDTEGTCMVPPEVMTKEGRVYVNLVGSNTSDGDLYDRLTTYSEYAFSIAEKVPITGAVSQRVSASQFEQYIDVIKKYVDDEIAALKEYVDSKVSEA